MRDLRPAPARRRLALALAVLAAGAGSRPATASSSTSTSTSASAPRAGAGTPIEVWFDPGCGCCRDWMAYLGREGFAVAARAEGNAAARRRLGLPDRLGSCHTATVGGYVVEGHVPAPDIRRLLARRPEALGLAVPGMPVGSPGMDGPIYRGRRDPYDVLLVRRDGTTEVFASHR
jgi:hypothetical protein